MSTSLPRSLGVFVNDTVRSSRRWAAALGSCLAVAMAAGALTSCGYSSDDPKAASLCQMLDDNKVTAPDQLARRVYGDGACATAAEGIRSTCADEHGAVAVYLDDTANYDTGKPIPQVPPGYGTASS